MSFVIVARDALAATQQIQRRSVRRIDAGVPAAVSDDHCGGGTDEGIGGTRSFVRHVRVSGGGGAGSGLSLARAPIERGSGIVCGSGDHRDVAPGALGSAPASIPTGSKRSS